jgi:excisionase family DNA binding protein
VEDTQLVSVRMAAEVLGVTARQVQNLIKDGILPAQKVGRAYVVREADLATVPRERKRGPKQKVFPAT